MKHLIFPLLLGIGLLMTGCDPATEYSFALRNGTDTTAIHLQATASPLGPIDTILQAGQQISLGVTADIGIESTPPSVIGFFEAFVITNVQGDTCQRDPMQDATWWIETEERGRRPKTYRHTYELLVIDTDF